MKKLLLPLAGALLAFAPSVRAQDANRVITIGVVARVPGQSRVPGGPRGRRGRGARDLGAKDNLKIKIDWRTPNEEDAQKQAEAVEQASSWRSAAGIAVSCSDANKLTRMRSIPRSRLTACRVATFDSDAPASKRFVTYGVDDLLCGGQVMDELAKVMDGRGVIAILAGNPNAPNLQRRVQGVRDAAKKYPGITIRDVYYHKETPQDAAARVEQADGRPIPTSPAGR